MQTYLAIDIGGSSGRHILGRLDNGRILTEEIYRFKNTLTRRGGHLCWDMPALRRNLVKGLKRCADAQTIPVSLGIDTWGVDFVLLDAENRVLGDAVAYRDSRTQGMDAAVSQTVSNAELYARTGIQKQLFNTIYQLAAVKAHTPELLWRAERLLMIPEYLNFLLTGEMVSEYTNATTTGLVNARDKTWDTELLDRLGYPKRLFGPLRTSGTEVGRLSREIQDETGFDCAVLLPPTHDTACAFLAIPAADDNAVYISSGTWSLLGTEIYEPVTTEAGRIANFSNEGGYGYRYRYLQNIMGLWMIQCVRRDRGIGFPEMAEAARSSSYEGFVNPGAACFLAPEDMAATIKAACAEAGQPEPETLPDVLRCIYNSLARSYTQAAKTLETLTGKRFTAFHIVGGGSRDAFLNEMTARGSGLPVQAGPVEATALGNIASQMLASGELGGLEEARAAIRDSTDIAEFRP